MHQAARREHERSPSRHDRWPQFAFDGRLCRTQHSLARRPKSSSNAKHIEDRFVSFVASSFVRVIYHAEIARRLWMRFLLCSDKKACHKIRLQLNDNQVAINICKEEAKVLYATHNKTSGYIPLYVACALQIYSFDINSVSSRGYTKIAGKKICRCRRAGKCEMCANVQRK